MKKVARFRGESIETGDRVGVRTTGRIKKAKVVFDPSDHYAPRSHRPPSSSTVSTTSTIPASHTLDIAEKRLQQQRTQNKDQANVHHSGSSSSSMPVSDASGSSIEGEKCMLCHRREPRKGVKKLIACIDCENNAHLSCMKIMFDDLSVLRNNYRCDNCRTCASCFEGPEDGDLVTCSKCVKSFHFTCHIPIVTKFTLNSKWLCSKCTPKINNGNTMAAKNIREIIGDVKLPEPHKQQSTSGAIKPNSSDNLPHSLQAKQQKPQSSTIQQVTSKSQQEKSQTQNEQTRAELQEQQKNNHILQQNYNYNDLDEIPDVKDWSVDKVVQFFKKYFPKEAHVFHEHEIDGQSLLLLKRSDVIKKLPLKLGPSLRIYNLVVKIQSKSNDPTIGWLN